MFVCNPLRHDGGAHFGSDSQPTDLEEDLEGVSLATAVNLKEPEPLDDKRGVLQKRRRFDQDLEGYKPENQPGFFVNKFLTDPEPPERLEHQTSARPASLIQEAALIDPYEPAGDPTIDTVEEEVEVGGKGALPSPDGPIPVDTLLDNQLDDAVEKAGQPDPCAAEVDDKKYKTSEKHRVNSDAWHKKWVSKGVPRVSNETTESGSSSSRQQSPMAQAKVISLSLNGSRNVVCLRQTAGVLQQSKLGWTALSVPA